MPRLVLFRTVICLFAVLALAFMVVLFISLGTNNSPTQDPSNYSDQFHDIKTGVTGKRRLGKHAVWVTRLSEEQRLQLGAMAKQVVNLDGCQMSLCILNAHTERQGIDLIFSRERPPQVAVGTPWLGGFVNPTNGAVYDLLGRAYWQNQERYQRALAVISE